MPGSKVNFDFPAALRFECTQCGICCGDTQEKTRHILLLSTEAEQIAKVTSLQIQGFAEKIKGKAPYVYEMKKTIEHGKCVFLTKRNCTIYPLRPLVCRFYPFELATAPNHRYIFRYTKECPSIGTGRTLSKDYFEDLFQMARLKTNNYNWSSTSAFSSKAPQ